MPLREAANMALYELRTLPRSQLLRKRAARLLDLCLQYEERAEQFEAASDKAATHRERDRLYRLAMRHYAAVSVMNLIALDKCCEE